jgi:hypothetical protein
MFHMSAPYFAQPSLMLRLTAGERGKREFAIPRRKTTADPSTPVASATFAQDDSYLLSERLGKKKASS